MENQPIEQVVQQPTAQPMAPTGQQASSANVWYGVAVVVVIAIALGVAYFVMNPASTGTEEEAANSQTTPLEQTQTTVPTAGNTTADISAELNQIPDTSASLDADAASSESDIQNL